MGEEWRVLVPPLGPLEPRRKGSVQLCAPGSGQAGVGDLTSQRVFDRVFTVTSDRGAGAAADEVALLEYPQIWLCPLDELVDGPCPEDPADHRSGLERLLLLGVE